MQPSTNRKFEMSWGDLYDAVKILKPFSDEFNKCLGINIQFKPASNNKGAVLLTALDGVKQASVQFSAWSDTNAELNFTIDPPTIPKPTKGSPNTAEFIVGTHEATISFKTSKVLKTTCTISLYAQPYFNVARLLMSIGDTGLKTSWYINPRHLADALKAVEIKHAPNDPIMMSYCDSAHALILASPSREALVMLVRPAQSTIKPTDVISSITRFG